MFQKGLKGIAAVQTKIASVDGDKGELKYRGLLVNQAVEGKTFEKTAFPCGTAYGQKKMNCRRFGNS